MTHITHLYECVKCGARYPLVPYFPKAAPHGPNRDCRCKQWVLVHEQHPPKESDISRAIRAEMTGPSPTAYDSARGARDLSSPPKAES